jgi:hypothetical protein
MLREDYPIYFNQTQILIPATWKESWNVVEAVSQSESGKDIVHKVRGRRLSVNCAFKCSDVWFRKFAQFSELDSFTLKRYDPIVPGYQEHLVRIRNFQAQPNRKSWDLSVTNGVWAVGFVIEEF